MANSKTKRSRIGFARHRKLALFILVVVIAVGGYLAYQAISLRQNKHDFQQASATINQIYSDVVKQVGKPDNAEIKSFCARAHQEFTQGELSCEVDTSFIYPVVSKDSANTMMQAVQSLISKHKFVPAQSLSSEISDRLVVNTIYHAASDKYKLASLQCTVNYVFDTPDETFLKLKDANKKPFEITIGCYGPAKQQYYRLASSQ